MNNKKSKKGLVILLVLLVVALMAIGYAAYTQTLYISGTANVAASSWNVLYNNADDGNSTPYGVVPTANSNVTATSASISSSDTTFSFVVPLAKPGDVYEATIYPHNFGTLTAYLKSVSLSGPTSDQAKYVSYSIKYDGTTYTASQSGITGKSLAAGAQVPVIVRVEYILPAESSDLPSSAQSVTISGSLGYSSEDA